LIKLDRLKIIELLPGNRAWLRVTRNLSWQAGGAMQCSLQQKLLQEFLVSDFTAPRAELGFYGGIMCAGAPAQVKHTIKNSLKEGVELSERDVLLPLSEQHGCCLHSGP
jgi:hypothetical protein